ncbi:MAG: hypothetical protein OXD44_11950 [Gammaproteobacteria bacterium]|nr:hypothetical protein [Gammaproteobacteria bacterium]MCY4226275.1 hypothetical protein [Gammaproteobacteria bacterium]MCY4314376.1 hypothetical protein [Gammaproteobacteria bacterium]
MDQDTGTVQTTASLRPTVTQIQPRNHWNIKAVYHEDEIAMGEHVMKDSCSEINLVPSI